MPGVSEMTWRITFLSPSSEADGMGGHTGVTYTDSVTVYAEWLTPRAIQRYIGQRIEEVTQGGFRIHWRSGITGSMRVRDNDGTVYHVTGVYPAGGYHEWLIVTVETVSGEA